MILLENRAILAIEGEDAFSFLQGLMTNDVKPLEQGDAQSIYSAMLTPQGKIRFDFFLFKQDGHLLMDVAAASLEDIKKALKLYKLRAKVAINEHPDLCVVASLSTHENYPQDPRLPAMEHRGIASRASLIGEAFLPMSAYDAHRIACGVPDSSDFIEDRAFVSEYGLEYLNGVSFTKGCYVGQEVVARTKHRGTVHKTIHYVEAASGEHLPEAGTPIIADDREIGQLRSSAQHQGLAIIRRDKLAAVEGKVTVGGIELNRTTQPEWFA
ncbi:MAG: hypothetical protein P8P30_06200 [Rickettsiales bacterium]|nr:hypothetical protein [Rickettsiales bacterium]